jgi:hypothetical protein
MSTFLKNSGNSWRKNSIWDIQSRETHMLSSVKSLWRKFNLPLDSLHSYCQHLLNFQESKNRKETPKFPLMILPIRSIFWNWSKQISDQKIGLTFVQIKRILSSSWTRPKGFSKSHNKNSEAKYLSQSSEETNSSIKDSDWCMLSDEQAVMSQFSSI